MPYYGPGQLLLRNLLFTFFPFNQLLLGNLGLPALTLRLFRGILPSLVGKILPEDLCNSIRVIRGDRRPHFLAPDDDFYELGLVLAVGVEREPVVEVFGAETPTVGHLFRIVDRHAFDFGGQDAAGRCKREIVFVYYDQFLVDGDLRILV